MKIEINNGMKKMIEENALGFATMDKEGNPHNIAIGYVEVVDKDKLLIINDEIKESIENIKINPNIAIVVWNKEWKENCIGYELKGRAEYYTEGKWYERIKKTHPEFPSKGAILATINKIKSL